jgi:hypothetical protein
MLLYFGDDVEWRRNRESRARDSDGVVDLRLLSFRKFHVQRWSDDLRNLSKITHL